MSKAEKPEFYFMSTRLQIKTKMEKTTEENSNDEHYEIRQYGTDEA